MSSQSLNMHAIVSVKRTLEESISIGAAHIACRSVRLEFGVNASLF
jgi:hypothetical protein